MNLVVFAGVLSLIPFVYLLRLMTDARQLRERFRTRALVYAEDALPYLNTRWSGQSARRAASDPAPAEAGHRAGGPPQAS